MINAVSIHKEMKNGEGVAVPILSDVNLAIKAGEVVVIWGPNMCGKSTLLRVLSGVLHPDSGTVEHAAGVLIGYVPQDEKVSLLPWFDAERNVRFLSRGQCDKNSAEQLLADFGFYVNFTTHKKDDARKRPHQLSGGLQQRLAMACAFGSGANCLIMDEPFSGQDEQAVNALISRITCVRTEGRAVVLVTHDPDAAIRCADRVCFLKPQNKCGSKIAGSLLINLSDRTPSCLDTLAFQKYREELFQKAQSHDS